MFRPEKNKQSKVKQNTTSTKSLDDFFGCYPLVKYDSGEKIVRPSELTMKVISIKSGLVKIYSVSSTGQEIVLGIFDRDKYSSFVTGVMRENNRFYIEALTETLVHQAPRDDFMMYINNNPEAIKELTDQFSGIMSSLFDQLEGVKVAGARNKIAAIVSYLANQIGEKGNKGDITISKRTRLTHKLMANLSGLTRETVTLQLNKLEEDGLVEFGKSGLMIKDVDKLREEAGI